MSIYKVETRSVKGTEGAGYPVNIYAVIKCDEDGNPEEDMDMQDDETPYFDSDAVRSVVSTELNVDEKYIEVH